MSFKIAFNNHNNIILIQYKNTIVSINITNIMTDINYKTN